MKKRKPSGPIVAGQKPSRTGTAEEDGVVPWREREQLRSSATGPPPARLTTATPDSAPRAGKREHPGGRLDRAVLAMLGKGLEDCFDEVRRQGVPERFKSLLQQF